MLVGGESFECVYELLRVIEGFESEQLVDSALDLRLAMRSLAVC